MLNTQSRNSPVITSMNSTGMPGSTIIAPGNVSRRTFNRPSVC